MKPILFNTEMVQAITEGRKTVTRRIIKPRYKNDEYGFHICTNIGTAARWVEKYDEDEGSFDNPRYVNPPYQAGDILYVRETWCYHKTGNWYGYRADGDYRDVDLKWKPSIHMPKEAARIFLKVTDVRVEKLQDITEEQAIKEGFEQIPCTNCRGSGCSDCAGSGLEEPALLGFMYTWDNLYEKRGYGQETNCWVWVIEFERVEVENG